MNLRLSDEEIRMLDILSEYYEITKSDFLIDAIHSGYKLMKKMEKGDGDIDG